MTLDGEDCFDNQYYLYFRRLLTVANVWPYIESSKRLPYTFLIITLMFLGIYTQTYVMLTSERKVEANLELLQTLLPAVLFTCTYWNLLYNFAVLRKTLERVKNDWNELTCEDELNTMQIYASQSKAYSQTIGCAFCFYFAFLVFPSIWYLFLYIFGIVEQTKFTLPINDELFMTTTWTYFIIFSMGLIIIPLTFLLGLTHYSLFILFLQHSCALFIILTDKIGQPFIKNEYRFCWTQTSTKNKREAELQWIVAIVKNYNNAIKFVELIKSLYGKIYITEVSFLFCLFIINFICVIRVLSSVITAGEALKVCLYINGCVLTIYAYFALGEKLLEHSTSVYEKCRMVPFYALTVQTNKHFLLFIMRSMKPCSISFGGVAVASHELFATMAKTSFSFATILYNVR